MLRQHTPGSLTRAARALAPSASPFPVPLPCAISESGAVLGRARARYIPGHLPLCSQRRRTRESWNPDLDLAFASLPSSSPVLQIRQLALRIMER